MGRKSSHNKGMELERYSLLTLIGVIPEISWETHKRVHTENQRKTRTWSYEIDTVSHSLNWDKG